MGIEIFYQFGEGMGTKPDIVKGYIEGLGAIGEC
jgi:hypothetical protein